MDACKGCGKDMERVSTHWAGCHEHHPECAAYREGFREGFRAGMRAAAAMCNAADKSTHPADLADAILAEADK